MMSQYMKHEKLMSKPQYEASRWAVALAALRDELDALEHLDLISHRGKA